MPSIQPTETSRLWSYGASAPAAELGDGSVPTLRLPGDPRPALQLVTSMPPRLALAAPREATPTPVVDRARRIPVPGTGLDITFISPTSFRVRSSAPDAATERVPEYMIVKADSERRAVPATVSEDGDTTTVATEAVRVRFTKAADGSVSVDVLNAVGRQVISGWKLDQASRAMQLGLRSGERVYGFGDKRAALDQRGHEVEMVNRDAFASATNASYKSIPFYFTNQGYGLFFHNFYPSRFDVGATTSDTLRVTASAGNLDAYVFVADAPRDIIGAYTELTGRPAMLPRWALGYHQAKASYKGDDAMRVAREMRARRLPLDAIFYDDWDDNAATPRFNQQLWDRYQTRLTMGGNPFLIGESALMDRMGRDHQLMSDRQGRPVIETADEIASDKGKSDVVGYVDWFSRTAARTFMRETWGRALEAGKVNRGGVRGPPVYLGMADFGEMDHVSSPDEKVFPSVDMPVSQARNVYALAYATGLVKGAQELTQGRSTGMIRPGFAGTQRFGWSTTGDSTPDFENFRAHTRGMLSLTHSGFSNVGQDIGGWDHKGPDDVYARWFAAATFFPFMWSHGQGDHEPYVHGTEVEAAARDFLELRYRMLPYIYALHEQANRTGTPALRSMAFQDIQDPHAARIDDQFFLGDGVLVAPVFDGAGKGRSLYLPPGTWYDLFGESAPVKGGRELQRDAVPLNRIPAYVRAGSIIPMGAVVQRSDEQRGKPIEVHYYAHGDGERHESSFELYEDDGTSQRYREGAFARTTLHVVEENGVVRFDSRRTGGDAAFQPPRRDLVIRVHGATLAR